MVTREIMKKVFTPFRKTSLRIDDFIISMSMFMVLCLINKENIFQKFIFSIPFLLFLLKSFKKEFNEAINLTNIFKKEKTPINDFYSRFHNEINDIIIASIPIILYPLFFIHPIEISIFFALMIIIAIRFFTIIFAISVPFMFFKDGNLKNIINFILTVSENLNPYFYDLSAGLSGFLIILYSYYFKRIFSEKKSFFYNLVVEFGLAGYVLLSWSIAFLYLKIFNASMINFA